jgi:hypothetical protein
MKTFLFSAVFLFAVLGVSAQESPEKIIENFFQDYQQGDPGVALDNLYKHMPWADRIQDDLEKVKSQFVGLQSLVGKYYGSNFIVKKELAGTFSLYSYLGRFERQPVRFVFKFYKPQDQWFLYGFSYDDSFSDEMEEAVKVFNLK